MRIQRSRGGKLVPHLPFLFLNIYMQKKRSHLGSQKKGIHFFTSVMRSVRRNINSWQHHVFRRLLLQNENSVHVGPPPHFFKIKNEWKWENCLGNFFLQTKPSKIPYIWVEGFWAPQVFFFLPLRISRREVIVKKSERMYIYLLRTNGFSRTGGSAFLTWGIETSQANLVSSRAAI